MTELGEAVNNIMKKAFPSIVDVNFTANMESLLDGVEEGSVKWKEVIRNFYPDLNEAVKAAEKELDDDAESIITITIIRMSILMAMNIITILMKGS